MERLKQLAYGDRARAMREIGALTRTLPAETGKQLGLLLASSPGAEVGLGYFEKLRERQPAGFRRLTASVNGLRCLIAVFTHSRFLSQEILRQPAWLEELLEPEVLLRAYPASSFRGMLERDLSPGPPVALEFARFRRKQMLRILLRDVLGLAPLAEVTGELSALADAIVETAYRRIYFRLAAECGKPRDSASEAVQFSVLALGKLGGEELNYSSDIDLMFLYSANGQTDGTEPVSNKEFFRRAAQELTELLSTYTPEGMCYRVDLRLRPEGRLGEICISLEGAYEYYGKRARDWELQMLIKARVAAGDLNTGRTLLEFVEPRIYATSLDFPAIEQLSATRERIDEKMAARAGKPATMDVKLERGGIRDIEFLVQCLQRLYGGTEPWVRHGGTLLALARLHDKGSLSDAEYGRLAGAYQFLRRVEHCLQIADDLQTHSLPGDEAALNQLGALLGGDGAWLEAQLGALFAQVVEIYDRVIHSRTGGMEAAKPGAYQPGNVVRALDQRAPRLAAALAAAATGGELQRGYRSFEHFLERISSEPEQCARLDGDAELAARVFDLFEHSPHFAEELIRTPDLIEEVARAGEPLDVAPESVTGLRRWYRRMMVRIQAGSIGLHEPVFETLKRTSELAGVVIARAYEIAVADVQASNPPRAEYRPAGQMWVVALGRLGMLEFDMGSDADLVFVLADSDAAEVQFWTRVARRVVDSIMAYTGEGVIFAVDTRLRPNGADGPLVQTEGFFKEYFANAAETWEGITYLKSRVVAGDARRGEEFLRRLQELDWQRYGQSGRSRGDLREMRLRIEKEHSASQPLKAGRGGYYDIDFMLMYLRLKTAGVYYKVLNTPERIEVLENMGRLDKAGAGFLRDAATFYRALDHAIRLSTGHAEAKLPSSEERVEILKALLKRWTPAPLDGLDEMRSRTRGAFERMFG